MIESLVSPKTKENVLFFLAGRNEGYAREIAKYYNTSLSPVQNQLENLEIAGIIVSKAVGKTVVYRLNPRYSFYKELVNLLEKAISFLPQSERERLLMNRRRPRRSKKPLK
ncbi:MAG: winged helix-turn-helix domain-containing protein [Ignavibacteria bacterium]|nr:winged helix-turn-helix domain-containing protein [Ignavibacteria bacterium]